MTVKYISGPPYPGGVLDTEQPGSFPLAAGAGVVVVTIPRDAIFAVIAYPYDNTNEATLPGPPYPGGVLDYPTPGYFNYFGKPRAVYFATEGFRTKPSDSPASTWFPGKLAEPANTRITLFSGAEPVGDVQRNEGELRLTDLNGEFDVWKRYGWDARRVEIYRGQRKAFRDYKKDPAGADTPWSTFTRVAILTTSGVKYDRKEKTIMLRAMQERLYSQQLLQRTYGGTGGLDGDDGAKGRFVPQGYGPVFNFDPVLFDSTNLVWQLHDRAINAVNEARDGGSVLTFSADYDTYEELVAATIPDGYYATCLALGLIRLKNTPRFGLRVDFEGEAASFNGFGYINTHATIVRRLATTRGAAYLNFNTEIDHYSVQRLDSEQPAECGVAFRDAISVGSAIDKVLLGIAGFWTVTHEPKLFVGQLFDPTGRTPEHTFTFPDDFLDEPEMQSYVLPRYATRVGYQENYGTQAPSDLAADIAMVADLQRLYGEQFSFAERSDPRIRTMYPGARKVAVPSAFKVFANADAEAVRQQVIFGVRRERWRLPVRYNPFSTILGRVIAVRGFDRYDFGSYRLGICVGISERASSNRVELDFWC